MNVSGQPGRWDPGAFSLVACAHVHVHVASVAPRLPKGFGEGPLTPQLMLTLTPSILSAVSRLGLSRRRRARFKATPPIHPGRWKIKGVLLKARGRKEASEKRN